MMSRLPRGYECSCAPPAQPASSTYSAPLRSQIRRSRSRSAAASGTPSRKRRALGRLRIAGHQHRLGRVGRGRIVQRVDEVIHLGLERAAGAKSVRIERQEEMTDIIGIVRPAPGRMARRHQAAAQRAASTWAMMARP